MKSYEDPLSPGKKTTASRYYSQFIPSEGAAALPWAFLGKQSEGVSKISAKLYVAITQCNEISILMLNDALRVTSGCFLI